MTKVDSRNSAIRKIGCQLSNHDLIVQTMKVNVMLKYLIIVIVYMTVMSTQSVFAEEARSTNRHIEIESLVPMFFYDGYHAAVGYRLNDFRIRASILYGGDYDAEPAGISNSKDQFSRYYDHGSWGVFFGYFVWKNLELYAFAEHHEWRIKNKGDSATASMRTFDIGPGVGYQFFFQDHFYIQPAFHVYFRGKETAVVGNKDYTIPAIDQSVVLRLGYRF